MVDWSKHRAYVIGHNRAVERVFHEKGIPLVASIKNASIVVWTGGSDVSPELYNEKRHPSTTTNKARDKWEKACFEQANDGKRLLVGICRGGQFLNVMNSGTLWQDVTGHALMGEHKMFYVEKVTETLSRETLTNVNSTHHQMIIPNSRGGAEVWGKAGESTRKTAGNRLNNGTGDFFSIQPNPGHLSDCEICWYPATKSLCFQPHPEYGHKQTQEIFWKCMERAAGPIEKAAA